ncbi:Acetyltransferase (GNAT) family protein [compost metagenome]
MENVTTDWLVDELESMRLIGFNTFKIVEIQTNKIIGTIDMKIESEVTYLSLLILHQDYINKGYGTNIYKELEKYIKSLKSKSIRIDVVTKNNVNVLEFWVRNGFTKDKEIELNWSGMILPAVSMTKKLYII